jgi:hypothetical protein
LGNSRFFLKGDRTESGRPSGNFQESKNQDGRFLKMGSGGKIQRGYFRNGLQTHVVVLRIGERNGMKMRRNLAFSLVPICLLLLCRLISGNTTQESKGQQPEGRLPGGLIPAQATMATAWDIPRDPLEGFNTGELSAHRGDQEGLQDIPAATVISTADRERARSSAAQS